jgi:hypothetical protein
MIKKHLLVALTLLFSLYKVKALNNKFEQTSFNVFAYNFYIQINEPDLNFDAFYYAIKGFYNLKARLKISNDSVLSILDFSQSANTPRFYLIDMLKKKLIKKTLVSHGKNSGKEFAFCFSNELNSQKSALGFFLTSETYLGKHGYSLRMEGLEKNINDNARKRDIVVHGAAYVNPCYIKKQGFIGRSHGCPALPYSISKSIIDKIKECSCLFIYFQDFNYLNQSHLINSSDYLIYFDR